MQIFVFRVLIYLKYSLIMYELSSGYLWDIFGINVVG